MIYDFKQTEATPQLGIRGDTDLYCERKLVNYGAYFVRIDRSARVQTKWTQKTHYAIAMPMASRVLGDSFLNRLAGVTEDAKDLIDKWGLYEKNLVAIKASDEKAIDDILNSFGVNGDFFHREPFLHQKAGLAFFLASFGHICILDEMRTGKTYQAINIARYLLKNKLITAVLCIVPNTIKYLWQREFMLDAPMYSAFSKVIAGTKTKKRYAWEDRYFIYIVNYESARADAKELYAWQNRHPNYLLICDEAHALKNPQAQQTQVVTGLSPKYSIFMTGTPVSTWPEDVFSMAHKVCPGLLGPSIYHFREKFAVKGGFKGKQIISYRNLDEIKYRLAHISIRRKRKDIMFDLTIYQNRDGEMEGDQKKAYNEIRDLLYTELVQDGELTSVQVGHHLTKTLRLYQITSGFLSAEAGSATWFKSNWKLKELDAFIDDYLDEIGKVVIWSRFVPPVYFLADRYAKHGAVYIKGGMKDQADENMYRFQQDDDCKIMIAQIQTAVGRGFQPATVCIFLNKWWTPLPNAQARDRITGIKNPVPITVISLVTKDAIDERIEFILGQRQQWADAITGDTDDDKVVLPKMDKATLLYLLANPEKAREYEATHGGK